MLRIAQYNPTCPKGQRYDLHGAYFPFSKLENNLPARPAWTLPARFWRQKARSISNLADIRSISRPITLAGSAWQSRSRRFVTKYNHRDGKLTMKMTDDVVCVQFSTNQLQDVKRLEKLSASLMRSMVSSHS
ncbi:hypothetical protein OSTOST_04594 [Ostertagia ostertagi]